MRLKEFKKLLDNIDSGERDVVVGQCIWLQFHDGTVKDVCHQEINDVKINNSGDVVIMVGDV